MRTYEDNVEAINELWQTFAPTHELRQLFRERLSKLDQIVLYEAIKQARVDNEGPWPAIKWFTVAYANYRQKRRDADPPRRDEYVRNVIPQPDTDAEKKLVQDFYAAIEGCTDQGFRELDEMILDKHEQHELSSLSAFRLCRALRVHLFGDGPGLSRVDKLGELVRVALNTSF